MHNCPMLIVGKMTRNFINKMKTEKKHGFFCLPS